jgi:hypothetical protein
MRLVEVALSSCWLVVDDLDAPAAWTLHVFGPSKVSDALQLYQTYDGIIADIHQSVGHPGVRLEVMHYKTDNGFHLVLTGRSLPEDIFFLSFTEKQAQAWIQEKRHKVRFADTHLGAVEVEPDSNSLSKAELKQLLHHRVNA